MVCKNCIHWERLLSVEGLGFCKNRCGKVKVQCNETETTINNEVNILTEHDFGCTSGIEEIIKED